MYNILVVNQKGGVGKSTIADELAFALERQGKTVNFITIDPQGGLVHENNLMPEMAEYQIIDTPGVLNDKTTELCQSADLVLVPVRPSPRDWEPTMRTYTLIKQSKTNAKVGAIINEYNPFGILDRDFVSILTDEGLQLIARIPKTVALAQAVSRQDSIAKLDPHNPAVAAFDDLASFVIDEATK